MGQGISLVASQAEISLSRIERGLKVVGQGDDREQDQQQHDQGNELPPPVDPFARTEEQPQAEHHPGQQPPRDIEC